MSFYQEELTKFEYYKKYIPLFYRNSYGFVDQFKMLFEMILNSPNNGIIFAGDSVLSGYNIFDENYLTWLNDLDPSGMTCDILEKVASIFGVDRQYTINSDENSLETLTLTNEEMLMLIKCEIIKNNFMGTREECNRLYDMIGLNIFSLNVEQWGDHAKCRLVLASTPERPYSENIRKLFKAGYLHIASIGIQYIFDELVIPSGTLIWDSQQQSEMWDFGGWSEAVTSELEWDSGNWDEGGWVA